MNKHYQIKSTKILHEYWERELRAEVFVTPARTFGCRFYKDNCWVKDEVYPSHSEIWAENAAENYVLGIKKVVPPYDNYYQ